MNYPNIKPVYLNLITDSAGIIQHCAFAVPNRTHGYTTDDNARALIVALGEYEQSPSVENLRLLTTYLSFLHYAYNPGYAFRNIMNYQRVFQDINGTDDCLGRSLWACGTASSANIPEAMRLSAKWLFDETFLQVDYVRSPRAKAYALLGLSNYLRKNPPKEGFLERASKMAESLNSNFAAHSDSDWQWYEPYLTYGNAILPMGMMAAWKLLESDLCRETAVRSLEFLTDTLIIDGKLDLIGNDGWYAKNGTRAIYDQQSIDAGYTVIMYTMAHEYFNEPKYRDLAYLCYDWFFGKNREGIWVYDPQTGGCYDAVIPGGVNLNQGAESITCLLMAQQRLKCMG